MSLASILIQEEMNGTTFEDDSVPYDSVSMDELNAYISMESCGRDLDDLYNAQKSIHDIYDVLESTDRLSMEANEYLGLALDAALGKQETIYLGRDSLKSSKNVFTLEADSPDSNAKKDSIIKKIWDMFVAGFNKLVDFFKNVGSAIGGLFNKLGKYDKKLEKLKKQVSSYTPPSEYTMPKKLAASLADDRTSIVLKDIGHLVDNLSIYTTDMSVEYQGYLTSAIHIIQKDKLSSEELLEQIMLGVKSLMNLSKSKSDIELPGNQVLEGRKVTDTWYGSIPKVKQVVNEVGDFVIRMNLVGERPDKEIKFTSAPDSSDINRFLTRLEELSKSTAMARDLQKTMKSIKDLKKPRPFIGGEKPSTYDKVKHKVSDSIDNMRIRLQLTTSPWLRYPAKVIKECFRVYGAGLMLVDDIMKGNTTSK